MTTRIELLATAGDETSATLHEYIIRRLSFAVRRFRHRIRHVTIRLVDLNGPRRGVDTRCSMVAELMDGGRVVVAATAAWPFGAMTLAAGRLSEALRRDADRQHSVRRRGSAGASRFGRVEPWRTR